MSDRPADNPPLRETHFVRDARAVEEGLRRGVAVTSACGKRFVPSRDPEQFPVCWDCFTAILDGPGWAA